MSDYEAPIDRIADRVADVAPTRILPFMAALRHQVLTWQDHRQRTNDGHQAQMQALGLKASEPAQGDEMGDMMVARDISIMQPTPPAAPQSAGLSTLGKLGVGAALLTGGAGAGIVGSQLLKDQPPPAVVEQVAPPSVDTDSWLNSDFGISVK